MSISSYSSDHSAASPDRLRKISFTQSRPFMYSTFFDSICGGLPGSRRPRPTGPGRPRPAGGCETLAAGHGLPGRRGHAARPRPASC
eukprot:scaffold29241_cov79-Isochrysis_galbana.AAC.1